MSDRSVTNFLHDQQNRIEKLEKELSNIRETVENKGHQKMCMRLMSRFYPGDTYDCDCVLSVLVGDK